MWVLEDSIALSVKLVSSMNFRLIFFQFTYYMVNAQTHTGCQGIEGDKWLCASKWIVFANKVENRYIDPSTNHHHRSLMDRPGSWASATEQMPKLDVVAVGQEEMWRPERQQYMKMDGSELEKELGNMSQKIFNFVVRVCVCGVWRNKESRALTGLRHLFGS